MIYNMNGGCVDYVATYIGTKLLPFNIISKNDYD